MPGWLVNILITALGLIIAAVLRVFFAPAIETFAARVIGKLVKGGVADVRGTWQSTYEYPSRGHDKSASQVMKVVQIGKSVYAKNIGGTSPHKHSLNLKIDGQYLTGTWSNVADKANHHGVVQMRLAADGSEMSGRWVGFDSGAVIQGGVWVMSRL